MRLITEETIKKIIKAGKFVNGDCLELPADCLLTPSAKAAVIDCKLTLVQGTEQAAVQQAIRAKTQESRSGAGAATQDASAGKMRYTLPDGSKTAVKPEHMTQLNGTQLVCKDDPRIRLRGEIDLFTAELLKAQLRLDAQGYHHLVQGLQDIYDLTGKLSRAEVLDEPFLEETIIGLSWAEVREVSHHPQKHFGRGHLFNISYREGEAVVLLNALRAFARRVELAFYDAFKQKDGSTSRPDLMEGYNRLSSALYILCLRAVTGVYGEAHE